MDRLLFPIKQGFNRSSRFLLESVLLKSINRPDLILRSTFNTMDPTPERVISNFLQGTFLLGKIDREGLEWRSYPERAVITPKTAKIPSSLPRYIKKSSLVFKVNASPDEVIRQTRRESQNWVNEDVIDLYSQLDKMGYVTTLEMYDGEELVAGIWGLRIGRTYSIMSMFHHQNHAGSILFARMLDEMNPLGVAMIDCGAMSDNFARYGAVSIPLEEFIERVVRGLLPQNSSTQKPETGDRDG